ncbi:MAG: primosomal protein N' [bacterium]
MEGPLTAEVVVPIPMGRALTYSVPARLEDSIRVGSRVIVEVKNKTLTGFVVALARAAGDSRSLKPVKDVAERGPVLTRELLRLGAWIADYYVSHPGEVLAAMSPPPVRLRRVYRLARTPADLELEIMRATAPGKAELVSLLAGSAGPVADHPRRARSRSARLATRPWGGCLPVGATRHAAGSTGFSLGTLKRKMGGSFSAACLRELVAEGVVEVEVAAASRRQARPGVAAAAPEPGGPAEAPPELTAEQRVALGGITDAVAEGAFRVFLLYGVTGSGKTEVYLRAIEEVLRRGKKAIYLVPEIALTPQIMDRAGRRFGARCAVLHSRLSDGERYSAWLKVLAGEIDVVVGARSAVFAPIGDLGIVVVDEEHEASYKQQEAPRYNAREVAIVRAKQAGAVVVLGSATPAVETYNNALAGRYRLAELPERISGGGLPEVRVVDMRTNPGYPLTETAVEDIARSLEASEQVVLFLNRRGFANYIQCRDCGMVPKCRNCQVTLTYHLGGHRLACHYCGYVERGWDACPKCGGADVDYVGSGTQKVEEAIVKAFPQAACARLDKDSTRLKGATEAVLGDFMSGMVRMLVGTQMLAKGHDFKGVGLVVVVNADVTMNVPDFRSAERTFQIVTQVAGRAGRGDVPGRVVIQTFNPDHHALSFAAGHDFKGFYASEIGARKDLGYPPFSRLARLVFEAGREGLARQAAEDFAAAAPRAAGALKGRVDVVGPSRAPLAKIKNVYRWHLLLKGDRGVKLADVVRACLADLEARGRGEGVRIAVDVDPQVMM